MKVSFDMDSQEIENLTMLIHDNIVKYRHENQLDESYTPEEKAWFKKHADYLEKEILNPIVKGIQR